MFDDEKKLLDVLGKLNDKVDTLLTDVSGLKSDVAELKSDVAELKTDVSVLKSDMTKVKSDITRLEALETEVKALHFDVVELRMTCENDLNKQIRIIAEAHGDLIRYFSRALERKAEMEEYAVRVVYLEGEVRRLKHYWDAKLSA